MVIRILSHWKVVGSGLICRMSCYIINYLIFLASEILLDLQDNMLLGIILFPLSMGFTLICGM